MASKSETEMQDRWSPHFPQQWNASHRIVRQLIPAALMIVVLLGWAGPWGIPGSGIVYAQAPASPPYISAPVMPLEVTVPLPPSTPKSAATTTPGPMVTVPEGEPLPTEPPPPRQPISDSLIQSEASGVYEPAIEAIGLISDPIVNVAGLTSAANPPDSGDVVPVHI